MNVTETTINTIKKAIRDKGLNQTLVGERLDRTRSWVSMLLKGKIARLSPEQAEGLEDLLSIDIQPIMFREEEVSPSALYLSNLAKENETVRRVVDELATLGYQAKNKSLPWLSSEDIVALGEELVRVSRKHPGEPGKVGRIGLVYLARLLEKMNQSSYSLDEDHYDLPCLGTLAAGSAIYNEPFRWGDEPRGYVKVDKDYSKDYFAVQVCGDSMEPDIPDASTIVMRKIDPGEIKAGRIYAASDSYGIVLKTLVKKSRKWFLQSKNPKYEDFQPLEDAKIQAEFVEVIK